MHFDFSTDENCKAEIAIQAASQANYMYTYVFAFLLIKIVIQKQLFQQ